MGNFPGMQIEPVLVTQLIAAVIALAVAFGVPITDEQRTAVLQVTGVVVAIFVGGGLVARANSYSERQAAEIAATAYDMGKEELRASTKQG